MKIKFCFQGYLTTNVTRVYEVATGALVDCRAKNEKEIIEGLQNGKFAISLQESLKDQTGENNSVEMFDFEKSKD